MPASFGGRGGSGGGGGPHFRNPVDVFADTSARDTAFESGGTVEGEHTQFAADRSLAIVIGTIANPTNFQTYTGDSGTYDETAWLNRTDAVQGRTGAPGGGAWESLGTYGRDTVDASNDDIWHDMGFDWDDESPVVAYKRTDGNAAATARGRWHLLDGEDLYGDNAVDDGTIGQGNEADEGVQLQDESLPGDVFVGKNAAGRALFAFSQEHTNRVEFEFYKYVPSEVQGGLDESEVDARIAPYARATPTGTIADAQIPAAIMRDSELTSPAIIALITGNIAFSDLDGMIADGQIPAAIMRDAEFTKAAIATLLGITSAQVDQILVGNPTISGSDLEFTRADGTTVTITLPAGMGGGTADGRLRFGTTAPASTLGSDNDAYVYINATDDTATFYLKESGSWTQQFVVEDISTATGDHTRRAAISANATLETAEVMAGESSTSNTVTLPMWGTGVLRRVFIGVHEDEDDITDILSNGLSQFGGYEPYDDNADEMIIVEGHKWWFTTDAQDGEFYSQIELEIVQ